MPLSNRALNGIRSISCLPAALLALLASLPCSAAEPAAWTKDVPRYLETLRRDDGGYAWPDQAASHVTTTFAAAGAYNVLGLKPPNADKAATFVRDHHPQRGKKPEWELHEFDYQQVQAMLWLGADARPAFEARVRGWTTPREYLARYESHSYPPFHEEIARLLARELLGLPTKELPEYEKFLTTRWRANGSFNSVPAAADPADGHVLNTLWGLRGLRAMGREIERKEETLRWLRSCQETGGHFAYQPGLDAKIAGAGNDVIYTWAATAALKLLGEKPADVDACIAYLHSLHHSDGGFGDRPGWPSNSLATYYAVDALRSLDALDRPLPPATIRSERFDIATAIPIPNKLDRVGPTLHVYTLQVEAPGAGSPTDAVELARGLHIHLWGAKNAKPGWLQQAQKVADARKVPVRFFTANEEYGTFFTVPGIGTFSHLSDPIAPPGVDAGASLANVKPPPDWTAFSQKRLAPLAKAGGRMVYQFSENEPMARMLLDESLANDAPAGGVGFAAISTFHFGQPDFIRTAPYLWHYRHRIPQVAMQDNHAAEPWYWADQLEGFRTLFLAREPTWEGWLEAMRNNWVVSVRRDETSNDALWVHGGNAAARKFVMDRHAEWRWWQELGPQPAAPAVRPGVSIAVLTTADTFEAGRPEAGVTLRIRRRWQCTAQGMPKTPEAELVSVTVDGKPVEAKQVRVPVQGKKTPAGIADEYYIVALPDLPAGKHVAKAVVKAMKETAAVGGNEQTLEFEAPAKDPASGR
jgi:hypothetical protein